MSKDLIESLSGIRGIYGEGVTEKLAEEYIFAYCKLFSNVSRFVVGGDSRPSTTALKTAIIRALEACGVKEIIDVGVLPTQVIEHAVLEFKADGGVVVTASHNEPEYNGFKFLKQDGAILYPSQSEELIEMVHKGQEWTCGDDFKADVTDRHKDALNSYIEYILCVIGDDSLNKIKTSGLKILVDPNGGSGIEVLDRILKELGVDADMINDKLGEFQRRIEPDAKSMLPLAQKMKDGNYEFACGFDCDADRVEFVLSPESEFAKNKESVLDGNYVMALACDIQLKGTDGEVVVTNTVTSPLIRDVIKKHGATVKEAELGEMAVVEEMEKQKSIIGGEGSNGGVIIPPIKCRDGIMTLVLILKMLASTGRSLSDVVMDYPEYFSMRTKIACTAEESVEIQNKLVEYFQEKGYKVQKTKDLKVWFDDNSYVWFHQSGTEAGAFRIIVDGNNKEKVKNMLQQGIEAFNKFK